MVEVYQLNTQLQKRITVITVALENMEDKKLKRKLLIELEAIKRNINDASSEGDLRHLEQLAFEFEHFSNQTLARIKKIQVD